MTEAFRLKMDNGRMGWICPGCLLRMFPVAVSPCFRCDEDLEIPDDPKRIFTEAEHNEMWNMKEMTGMYEIPEAVDDER